MFTSISLVSQFLGPNRFDCVCIVTFVACFVVRFVSTIKFSEDTTESGCASRRKKTCAIGAIAIASNIFVRAPTP